MEPRPRNEPAPHHDPSAACIEPLHRSNTWGTARTTSQLDSSPVNGESQSTLHTLDSFDDSAIIDTPQSSFSDNNMPPTRRSSRGTPSQQGVHAKKRQRTSENDSHWRAQAKTPKRLASKDIDDLLFETPPSQGTPVPEDIHTIDLTETNDTPEDLKEPIEDKRIKLSGFQCVICMDDATNLTVTHCGHLYCADCLHQSLHVEASKGKCPMCRQKMDMKPRDSYNSKTRGYWPLELKLMTATRKGKRKAFAIA